MQKRNALPLQRLVQKSSARKIGYTMCILNRCDAMLFLGRLPKDKIKMRNKFIAPILDDPGLAHPNTPPRTAMYQVPAIPNATRNAPHVPPPIVSTSINEAAAEQRIISLNTVSVQELISEEVNEVKWALLHRYKKAPPTKFTKRNGGMRSDSLAQRRR